MYLVHTLHCIPLSLLNVTKKKQRWPWVTQTLDFEESFLEARVCNWVQGHGGWLWRCSHKGVRLQKCKAEDTHTNKTTHMLKQLWTGGHPWTHVMNSRTNRKATAGSFGTHWGFRTAASTTSQDGSGWVVPPRRPAGAQCSLFQNTSFDGGINLNNGPLTPGHHV